MQISDLVIDANEEALTGDIYNNYKVWIPNATTDINGLYSIAVPADVILISPASTLQVLLQNL
jgi:hypothetical protein